MLLCFHLKVHIKAIILVQESYFVKRGSLPWGGGGPVDGGRVLERGG